MTIASENYINKTTQRLYGILQGIALDNQLNDKEIVALGDWIESHSSLYDLEPFKSLDALILAIIADGVIDDEEKEILLEICQDVGQNIGFMDDITWIIRHLHGMVTGIVADSRINTQEILGLQVWLKKYDAYADWWPLKDLRKHIKKILKDGTVDAKEEAFLLDFFTDFIEQRADDQTIHDEKYKNKSYLKCDSPIFNSINSICESDPDITFINKIFCFTGPAASGQRIDLSNIVAKLGGIPHKSIVLSLDYLVIGAKSSPAWIYSTYGRKIEGVMRNKTNNPDCNTLIINEADFIKAVKAAHAFAE